MEKAGWLRCDRWMRAAHLYTGLLLTPWMVVYAVSAFCVNHKTWFSGPDKPGPKFEVLREVEYPLDPGFPKDPKEQVETILRHLDLEGAYRMPGDPQANPLVIYRSCAAGQYRITWHRQPSRLVVERYGPPSFYVLVNSLHFQHGYDLEPIAYQTWAVIVDVVTASTVIWVISGIYLWARRPRRRLLGGACLAAGVVLFAWLVAVLCQ
jgi:hypothetical protein